MPIFSYLAYPVQGAKEQLINDLAALDFWEVAPSENEEILILIAEGLCFKLNPVSPKDVGFCFRQRK